MSGELYRICFWNGREQSNVQVKNIVGRKKISFVHNFDTFLINRWTSSLWKLLWRELLVYTLTFLAISAMYRFFLSTEQQLLMEKLIRYEYDKNVIHIGNFFLLAHFFISQVLYQTEKY